MLLQYLIDEADGLGLDIGVSYGGLCYDLEEVGPRLDTMILRDYLNCIFE